MQSSKSSSTDGSSNSVYLVLQRYRSCKLLINETEWVTQGRDVPGRGIVDTIFTGNTVHDMENETEIQSDNHTGSMHQCHSQQQQQQHQQHCGLLIYVSFAINTNVKSCWEAAETCCNVPLLTNGLWGDSTSELLSLKQILTMPNSKTVNGSDNDGDHNRMLRPRTSVTIVPQANLICTMKRHGTSLQYHQQIPKDQGRFYYELFVNYIRANLYEYFYTSTKQEIPTALAEWKRQHAITTTTTTTETNSTTLENEKFDPSIPPMDLFRTATTTSMYGSYDTVTGLPTSDRQQQPLTKSALKKLRKIQEAHRTKHEKWLQQQQQQQQQQQSPLPSSCTRDERTNHDNVVTASTTDTTALTTTITTTTNNNVAVTITPPSVEESLSTSCLAPPPPPETTASHTEDDDDGWIPTMVVAGTFGKRQGIEITSDMGPFCHTVQI